MPATVGIVEARPESIVDDYRRVLQLGGLEPPGEDSVLRMVTVSQGGAPGFSSPAWQAPGVRKSWDLGPGRDQVLALEGPCPSLAANACFEPDSGPLLLLTVPVLEAGWGVRGAVAAWAGACGLAAGDPRSTPQSLAAGLARQTGRCLGVVCDGVLWGIRGGTIGKDYLQRNVLLAGTDPVAVDCIALQLAGMDPADFPWLQVLQQRNLGTADPEAIVLRGDVGLLAAPFAGAPLAGPGRGGRAVSSRIQELFWRLVRRRRIFHRYRESAWGRLALSLANN